VSDPAARARRGPAPVRRVAHAMAVYVASSCRHSMFDAEKRRVFAASNALDGGSDLPDNPVRFVRENVAHNQVTFRACLPASCCPGNVARARRIRCPPATIVR
jgi:hypothetical protein